MPASSVSTSASALAHEREDGAVVIGVDVHVEQPRGRRERGAQRLDDRGVTALREVRHGLEHESYSRSVKAYYEARAPEYDDWWRRRGLFEQRDRPGWDDERETLLADPCRASAAAHTRRRVRHRLS